jgi:uncharacterized membrane-anchored protein YhcB (DUF1043 family)
MARPSKVKNQQQVQTEAEQLKAALDNMAINIARISAAFEALGKSSVKRSLIRLMIKDMTQVSYVDIDKVLDALPQLAKQYLK